MMYSVFKMAPRTANIVLLSLSCLILFVSCLSKQDKELFIDGDLIIGGIFPIGKKVDGVCKPTIWNRGIQRMEAMLFAIDEINRINYVPGIRFGVHIIDSCSDEEEALRRSLAFVQHNLRQEGEDDQEKENGHKGKLIGVVSGSSSLITSSVAKLLQLFHIPLISFSATSDKLADTTQHNMFLRTVVSDSIQALAITDMIKAFNWSYVSIVSQPRMEASKFRLLSTLQKEPNICIAENEMLPNEHKSSNETYIEVLHRLSHKTANVVVAFVDPLTFITLMRIVKDSSEFRKFTWIVDYNLATSVESLNFLRQVNENIFTLDLYRDPVKGFEEYIERLKPETNKRNVWFKSFYASFFGCNQETCDSTLNLRQHVDQTMKIDYLVKAVASYATAAKDAWKEVCLGGGQPIGVCHKFKNLRGKDFFAKYLLSLFVEEKLGSPDSQLTKHFFDTPEDNPDPFIYRVMQYHFDNLSKFGEFVSVGKWKMTTENGLVLDRTQIKWLNNVAPQSFCSAPCEPGYGRVFMSGVSCCWFCVQCKPNEFLHHDRCVACPEGHVADMVHNGCITEMIPSANITEASVHHKRHSDDSNEGKQGLNQENIACRLERIENFLGLPSNNCTAQ